MYIYIHTYIVCLYIYAHIHIHTISCIYVCIYVHIYINTYNGILLIYKKNENLPLVAMRMDLENIMLSEINQTEKENTVISLICRILKIYI